MKVLLDTSVLVAALVEAHPHNAPSAAVLLAASQGRFEAIISAHSLAEVYAVLTRTPFSPRIYPAEAWQMLESVLTHVTVVALRAGEYREVVQSCSAEGWTGGAVYDAIHIRCARAAGCERLYTFNVREFRELAPENFRDHIVAP